MALIPDTLRLYLVTDGARCAPNTLEYTVSAAVRGGVSFVQLRDKTASTSDRISAARALKDLLTGSGVPLVINDDLEAAIAADVDGVHIGQDDITPQEARARLGHDKIIGLSCEAIDQVVLADSASVDYLGLGTVFPTLTKSDHKPAIGFDGLTKLAKAATCPSVAIGGLKRDHASAVMASGCDGMAVVSAICGQPDPENAARDLRRALDTAAGGLR